MSEQEWKSGKQASFTVKKLRSFCRTAVETWQHFAANEQYKSKYPLRKFRNNKRLLENILKTATKLLRQHRPDTKKKRKKITIVTAKQSSIFLRQKHKK